MKELITHLRGAIAATLVLAVVLCGVYPAAVWGIGQLAFREQANGSLIRDKDGVVRGSALLGQNFTGARYFHSRPSAAGAIGYDAAASSGSNLGPTSQKLADLVKERVAAYRLVNGLEERAEVPADAVTASASGLDPHISVVNARLQATRVARERGLPLESVLEQVQVHTDPAFLRLLGEPGVNVLKLNLALDDAQ